MRPRNQTQLNHSYFSEIDSEKKAYWLGFLMADGCVFVPKRGAMRMSVHLASRDAAHLDLLKNEIEAGAKISVAPASVKLIVCSDEMCVDLIANGCSPRKSLKLKYPPVRSDLVGHFIRGYFDGDGSVCNHGGRLFVSFCGTLDFLTDMGKDLGFPDKKPVCKGNHYDLQFASVESVAALYSKMYTGATVWLARKRDAYDEGLRRPPKEMNCKQCLKPIQVEIGRGKANRRFCDRRCRDKHSRQAVNC